MSASRTCTCLTASLALAHGAPAFARDQEQRLPRLEIRTAEHVLPGRGNLVAIMPERDGTDMIYKDRTSVVPFNPVDIGLTFEVTRLRRRFHPTFSEAKDVYSLKQLHITGRLPMNGVNDIILTGDAAYMKRRILAVPTSPDRGRVMGVRLGAGVGGETWTLTAAYETLGAKSRRQPMHRMAEILGGAPQNRDGLSLDLTGDHWLSDRHHLAYRLTERLAHRTGEDLSIIGASVGSRTERLGEIDIILTF